MPISKLNKPEPLCISAEEARAYLVSHLCLSRPIKQSGAKGVRALLKKLQYIQLDPLDPFGTNADLVSLARVDAIRRGDVYKFLLPGYAFEHFAKERCMLPADAFPMYRDQSAETPWWRLSERLQRIPESLITEVLDEIRERGPIKAEALSNRGQVKPLDWNGWAGTSRANSMAIEILWTLCKIVVCGRERNTKLYDVPSRALPDVFDKPAGDFERWALTSRVNAAGLLGRTGSSVWSMLSSVRRSSLPDAMVAEGLLEEIQIEGSSRSYLAPAGFRKFQIQEFDNRVRILGPLDPLLWDRALIRQIFDFDYVWEVYKPAHQRRWGWYVCPLLHRGQLVGRIEGFIDGDSLRVKNIWRERKSKIDQDGLAEALHRQAAACGVEHVVHPSKILTS